MAWAKAGSTTLTGTGDTITISSMTASKFNQTLVHNYADATGINPRIRVGTTTIDTGSNYASRYSANGGGDSTEVSQTRIHLSTRDKDEFEVIYSCNISGEEKLFIGSTCNQELAGVGTAPDRTESVGKWVTTSGQYDTIQALNEDSGDYPIGSNISALGCDLTPAAAIPAVDNVQDNSLFIEPSTARRYWFSEALAPTFEDDFDYATQSAADAVWVPNTTNIDVNVSTDVLDINNVGTLTTNISCVCDLGTISDTKWVLRYKVNWSTLSVGERYAQTFVGLSDKNGTVAWDGSQDSISVLYNRWGLFKQQNSVAASMQDWLLGSDMTDMSVSTDYYVETIRDGTSVSYTAYSDSAYSVPVSGISGTVTLNGNPTGLQYFVIRNDTTSGTGTTAGIIDDFEFYNGVTSAPPATWTRQVSSTPPTVAGLTLHLDSSDASTITKDGSNLVSAWNDKSGQANHVTQTTGSKQPLWVDQVQDTLPTIRFDGSSDEMAVTYGSALSTAATVFIVCTMPTASGGERMVFDGLTSGGRFAYLKSSGNIHYMYRGGGVSSTTVDKTMRMFTLVWNGSSSSLGIDGTDVTTGNVGTQSPTGLRLGAQYNSANFGDVDICEILLYGSALSTSDRTSIENYLSNKWSTP